MSHKYMQCFSFGAMMAALNVNRVDYFSLDVEGGEVPVLKTINWNDVYIDVIGIEYRYVLLHVFCVFFYFWNFHDFIEEIRSLQNFNDIVATFQRSCSSHPKKS